MGIKTSVRVVVAVSYLMVAFIAQVYSFATCILFEVQTFFDMLLSQVSVVGFIANFIQF